eukprot:9722282-Alexandrium_andersonii.AAC.1
MGEQRALFEQQLASMKEHMDQQMGVLAQTLEAVKLDAVNAHRNEEQLRNELVEIKRRELAARMAEETKAQQKVWHTVGNDVGLAT